VHKDCREDGAEGVTETETSSEIAKEVSLPTNLGRFLEEDEQVVEN
jgi:hypothetical protein